MGKIIAALLLSFAAFSESAVAYTFSGGRFGDCLLCYLHAKWLSYTYSIPVAYRSFILSSNLTLDEAEIKNPPGATKQTPLNRIQLSDISPQANLLYVCPYFPEDPWELNNSTYPGANTRYYSFSVDWKDPEFRKIALAMIEPKHPLALTLPRGEGIQVALHLREGGTYDHDGFRQMFPLKLPPLQFYIDGVLKIIELFPDKHLRIQVFTDATAPAVHIGRIESALPPDADVEFIYRKANRQGENVLEDFFSLFHYDVLIRSQSNFSMIPSLLRDYAVVYSPKDCTRMGRLARITEVNIDIHETLYQELLHK